MSAFKNKEQVEQADNLVMNTIMNSSRLDYLVELISDCNGLYRVENQISFTKTWARKEWRGSFRVWNDTVEKFVCIPVSLSVKVMRDTGDAEVSFAFADWEVWAEV